MLDNKDSRWMIIPFWDQESLLELHKKEDRAAMEKRSPELEFKFLMDQTLNKFLLTPFWDRAMPQEERNQNTEEYKRIIYPLWAKVWDAWVKTWNDPNGETELSVLHRCDMIIFHSGHKPNRLYLGSFKDQDNRKKKENYGRQYDEALRD